MKTRFNHSELCHVWAQQSQYEGKGSRMFFEGPSIYSYGRHFEIARFIEGRNIVLFNSAKYSVSTAKHQSYVRQALGDNNTVFVVPSMTNVNANLTYFKQNVQTALDKASRATKYLDAYLDKAQNQIQTMLHYCALFNIPLGPEEIELERQYNSGLLLSQEKLEELKKKEQTRRANEMLRKKEDIAKWLNHEKDHITIPEVLLRTNGNEVETTLGAKVELQEAKMLYERIQSNKPVNGIKIGYYTVIEHKDGILRIGCHKLKDAEISRFATLQGWNNTAQKN